MFLGNRLVDLTDKVCLKKPITYNFNIIYSTLLNVKHSLLFKYAHKPPKMRSKIPR